MAAEKNSIKLTSEEISEFCSQISLVIKAGISTYEGVYILAEHSSEDLAGIFKTICESLDEGLSFSDALETSNAFPDYVLHMVHLGEQTGNLENVMSSLADYYDRDASIRESIKHAVTYPIVMTVLMLVILFVLIGKVLPVFEHIYEELGAELTGMSKVLVNVSSSLSTYLIVLIIIVLAALIVCFFYFRSAAGKNVLNNKKYFMDIAVSRFASAMGLALSSGFDTDQGLDLALMLSDNPYLDEKINICKEKVNEGESFLNGLLASKIFDSKSDSMLHVGDKTGSMENVMMNLSKEYQGQADSRINRLISWLEPALVIVLCIVIGFILLAFLVPLLGIMASLG